MARGTSPTVGYLRFLARATFTASVSRSCPRSPEHPTPTPTIPGKRDSFHKKGAAAGSKRRDAHDQETGRESYCALTGNRPLRLPSARPRRGAGDGRKL